MYDCVSIPERVLEALKLGRKDGSPEYRGAVSIPERVLEALKPLARRCLSIFNIRFNP